MTGHEAVILLVDMPWSLTLPLLLVVSLFSVAVDSIRDPSVPDTFFPFGADVGDSVVPVEDDASSPAVNISTGFNFLFSNYDTAFVSIKVRLFISTRSSAIAHGTARHAVFVS